MKILWFFLVLGLIDVSPSHLCSPTTCEPCVSLTPVFYHHSPQEINMCPHTCVLLLQVSTKCPHICDLPPQVSTKFPHSCVIPLRVSTKCPHTCVLQPQVSTKVSSHLRSPTTGEHHVSSRLYSPNRNKVMFRSFMSL